MSEDLTTITDRMARTVAGVLAQFKGQPNIAAKMASYGIQFQEVENMFMQLYLLRALSTATGKQLDEIGLIVDEPRGDKDDTNYRAAIYARIALNRSHGRIEDILEAMVAIDPDPQYVLRELDDATFIVTLMDAFPATLEPETFNDALQRIKGGGVRAHFQYSDEADADTFTWADADVEQADADQGWADDTETTGGSWSDVVE